MYPWQAQLMGQPPKAQAPPIFTDSCRFFGWPPLAWGKDALGRDKAGNMPLKTCCYTVPDLFMKLEKRGNLYILPNSKKLQGWKRSVLTFPMFSSWSPRPEMTVKLSMEQFWWLQY